MNKQMIPKKLNKLLKQVDSKLETYKYECKCQTCDRVFFTASMLTVKQLMAEGKWTLHTPMEWYLVAGEHWANNPHHQIFCWVLMEGKTEILDACTQSWEQVRTQKGISYAQIKAAFIAKKLAQSKTEATFSTPA